MKWYTNDALFICPVTLTESSIHVALALAAYNQSTISTNVSGLWNVWFAFSVDFVVVLGGLWYRILRDYKWHLGSV